VLTTDGPLEKKYLDTTPEQLGARTTLKRHRQVCIRDLNGGNRNFRKGSAHSAERPNKTVGHGGTESPCHRR